MPKTGGQSPLWMKRGVNFLKKIFSRFSSPSHPPEVARRMTASAFYHGEKTKAAPMTMPTAMSMTWPRRAIALNSLNMASRFVLPLLPYGFILKACRPHDTLLRRFSTATKIGGGDLPGVKDAPQICRQEITIDKIGLSFREVPMREIAA